MDRFQQMSVFIAVAEEQGFAAAARRLNMSPPAVTRSVAALEAHLGVKLLQRSTRYVRTTEVGVRYLEDARHILHELEAADESAGGLNATPRGQLKVTAPVLFGRKFVMPGVCEYLQCYAQTEVSVMFVDRVVNLLEEGLDVGLRIGKLPDSSMRALPVGKVRLVLCASPRYLHEHGEPKQPEDLHKHQMIASRAGNHLLDLRFKTDGGERDVQYKARLTSNTNDAAIEAALQGFGITRLVSYQVDEYLASGQLQSVLDDYQPHPLPINILHREGRDGASKVRNFVDLMAKRLRSDTRLN